MTVNPITSKQVKQFRRLVEDVVEEALIQMDPDKAGLQRLLEIGNSFQARIFPYVTAGILAFTANYALAKKILGTDFISPEEITRGYGYKVGYDLEQLAVLGKTLPDQKTLEWCRDNGMMLIAGPPKAMSLLDIRDAKNDYFYSKKGSWCSDEAQKFAHNDKAEPIWIALRKELVADSLNKNWSEQRGLVVEPMMMPNAVEVVWGLTTYKAVRGVSLLSTSM